MTICKFGKDFNIWVVNAETQALKPQLRKGLGGGNRTHADGDGRMDASSWWGVAVKVWWGEVKEIEEVLSCKCVGEKKTFLLYNRKDSLSACEGHENAPHTSHILASWSTYCGLSLIS